MSKAIEPRLPSGFRDFDPTQAAARRRVLQIIEEQYLLMGSTPLETPAVEYEDVLIGAEDYSKQLYRVVRRGTEDGEAEEKNPLALRFDLTVPLARYIAAHQDLPMPFIRHQVGQVWRGERKQQGRYHEFTQFDLDIVGVSSLVADAQIIATMCNVMIALGIEKFKVKVGHRGLLDGLFDGMNVSAEDKMFFLRELDKVDPENPESIKDKFIEKGIKKEVVSNIFELLFGPSLKMFDISNFKGFEKKFEAKVNESQAQLQRLVANVKELGIDVDKWLSASPSIVRGLGYYTGPVWETVLLDAPEFGSVYSGGRYDDLLERFGSRKLPAVGTSIGVDRLMAALEKLGKLDELSQGSVQVVLANFGEEFIPEQLKIVAELRAAGISTELYLGKEKGLGQQIGYAEARGAKVVVLYGADEQKEGKVAIKNLATKEQVSVGRDQAVGAIGKNAVLTELV